MTKGNGEHITKNSASVRTLVFAGLATAIVTVLTMIVLPLPISNGYINLGDAGIFAAVGALGPLGIACAVVGSMLSDLILGYGVYAPATLLIKGLEAALAYLLAKKQKGAARAVLLIVSALTVPAGYFLFEGLFVAGSFAAALINVPFNTIQAIIGAALGFVMMNYADKYAAGIMKK